MYMQNIRALATKLNIKCHNLFRFRAIPTKTNTGRDHVITNAHTKFQKNPFIFVTCRARTRKKKVQNVSKSFSSTVWGIGYKSQLTT